MEGVDSPVSIGISDYAILLGSEVRTVEQIASFRPQAVQANMREIGLSRIPTNNSRPLSDMIAEICRRFDDIPDCVLIAHSLPFIRKNDDDILLFGDVPTFFLSGLPCAIMHKAVEVACGLIRGKFYRSVMVIGADKAYSDQERVFFDTIMGDALVAALLKEDAPHHKILASHISTTIYAPDGENSPEEGIKKFRSENPNMMRRAIRQCMEKAGVSHVDYFVTHTSNRKFWDVLSVLTKVPREHFLDGNMSNTGHTNSHDSFLHYFHFRENHTIADGDVVMLINPGFGGTQGCTLISS